jgi:diaminohydroxyphosphoribosylaminopyrimidine deaminase/5-amino-6-(5-phosphoribosylamino)uracil reductase
MERAVALAERGVGLASPNPLVGAIVVVGGEVVGEGWHEGPGTPHAEIVALNAAGERARGATLYSSLEPCDHTGRTGPCTDAIVAAGVARVVSAVRDPNALVDGRGYRRLRDAGVEVVDGVLRERAAHLNRAFFRHVTTGRPFVTWKVAATLDGKVAARDRSSRWITDDDARADAHRLRGWADAIVVGSGTVLADDPTLTVRDAGYRGRATTRVVVDARGRVDPRAAVFSNDAPTIVATTPEAPPDVREAWRAAGADVEILDASDGGVPMPALLERLGKRDAQGVLLEGGPSLAWSAVESGVVDELVLYLAPKLLGGSDAPTILDGAGLAPVAAALDVRIRTVERLGRGLKVVADVHRDR